MKRRDGFVLREIDGQGLLVPIGAQVVDMNGLVVLNDTARFVWERLDGNCSAADLAQALAGEFAVTPAQAQADVDTFLAEMQRLGLVDATAGPGN